MLFCAVFIYRYFCAVLRCSYPPYSPPPPHFRLLSDLKFYYMHVKVSILKPILVFSSMPPLFQDLQTLSGSDVYLIFVTYPPTPHPQGELVGLMAGSPEWTGLKGLKLLIALASTFQRIFWLQKNCFQADRTLKPGSAAGKKWQKTDWNGIKNRVECLDRPFSLPRLYRLAWLALFFFSHLSVPPTMEPIPRLNWSLCKILFF